jgi:hypothetical protein
LAAVVGRHPVRVLTGTAAVVVVLGVGLASLGFTTGQDTLVDSGSEVYRDNASYQDRFGGEPMLVLFTGDIRTMANGDGFDEITALEDELRATGEFPAVVGPAAALEFAAAQLGVAPDMFAAARDRDAAAAADRARAEVAGDGGSPAEQEAAAQRAAESVRADHDAALAAETTRLGAAGEHSLDNPAFVDFLLFDGDGEIRPALRDNFPDPDHGLLIVRLPGNASIEEQAQGAAVVEDIVARHPVPGVETLATGPPVLLAEINDYLQGGMAALGGVAVGVMVVLLLLVFRARWPLLPLVVVVVGAVGAFGAVGLAGIPLTLVTISGLPILIGLGVDFAIQMHNRFEEERWRGRTPADAVERTYVHMAAPLALAMLAAVAGFLALRWSRVPMIRDFGLLLSVGVVVLVGVALVTTMPVLVLRDRRRPRPAAHRGGRIEAVVRRVSSLPGRAAVPLVLAGLVVAVAGFTAEGGMAIQTDPERWVDQDGTAVTDLEALREGTGFSSELSILVEAEDVADPAVAAWMQQFGVEAVARYPDELIRATSMAALATGIHHTTPGGDDVSDLLSVAPTDAARSLVSEDRTAASIVFPIAPVSLSERERLLDDLAVDLEGDLAPPPGVTATPAGLAVIGVELVNGLEAGRRTLSLIALSLVFVWLVLAERRFVRAVLVLVPVSIAVALSSLAVAALGIELTPLTTVAGPLVIAVGTEFSVLVVARYVEERERGHDPATAVTEGVPHIGRAFVASGLTLVGGFGVLAFSPMPLLRDFGIVVALAVLFALATTLVLLPPLLVWADTRTWLRGFRPGAEADGPSAPSPRATVAAGAGADGGG